MFFYFKILIIDKVYVIVLSVGDDKVIIATNNKGKIREIKEIFSDYELYSLKDKGIDIDVVEDQDTFYGNALKKAKEIYEITKEAVIADDSGLCIEELDGWPGVLTHRFLGEDATDEERNKAIIDKVKNLDSKKAKVVCNMVYYDGNDTLAGVGEIEGNITSELRGTNGFGFDPIFELSNGKTLAELSSLEKNKVSARYLALIDLKKKLERK